MTDHFSVSLIGPLVQRGWREIVRFRPLCAPGRGALVAIRGGRVVSVIPTGGPRVLSDYLAWPCQYREVDARERALALEQQLDSSDAGCRFAVSLRLAYQVERPELVATAPVDPLAELERVLIEVIRQADRLFGDDQPDALQARLAELIQHSVSQRGGVLGLALRRVDINVAAEHRAQGQQPSAQRRPPRPRLIIAGARPPNSAPEPQPAESVPQVERAAALVGERRPDALTSPAENASAGGAMSSPSSDAVWDADSWIAAWRPVQPPEYVQTADSAVDEQVAGVVARLRAHGPGQFRMWAIELIERPERLPAILAEVMVDAWTIEQAAAPGWQAVAVRALQQSLEPTSAAPRRPASIPAHADVEPDRPDWLRPPPRSSDDGGQVW
ncbi:MAG: hypothetical protein IPO81_09190 [Kouleothrix sp.]|nr:hypothetical protein [Kouleothrix sp.]